MAAAVRVYVVTYRRPHLLERALRSLIAQSHTAWIAEVLNDDPADARVAELIARLGDSRIALSQPAQHRGGVGNFNHAFRTVAEPFASILEDDNWWEPDFLATMLAVLEPRGDIAMACGNERVWRELPDGRWVDTGVTIWPAEDGFREFPFRALDKCGSARLCNSSMLFRTEGAERWTIPASVPIDVSEHFRERAVPHPLLLVTAPLANFGDTLSTHRTQSRRIWASYQLLLLGSVFACAPQGERAAIARALWQRARTGDPLSATNLLAAGYFVPAAADLWRAARPREKLVFLLRCLRRPAVALALSRATETHAAEWQWLQRGPFAEFLAAGLRPGS